MFCAASGRQTRPRQPPLALDVPLCADTFGTNDFVYMGWMAANELEPQLASGADDGTYVSVAITRNPVSLIDNPEAVDTGEMRRRVCFAYENDEGAIGFDVLAGTVVRR